MIRKSSFMPLEIRELIIKVTVNDQHNNNQAILPEDKITALKNRIIKECIEKILLKIERINER